MNTKTGGPKAEWPCRLEGEAEILAFLKSGPLTQFAAHCKEL